MNNPPEGEFREAAKPSDLGSSPEGPRQRSDDETQEGVVSSGQVKEEEGERQYVVGIKRAFIILSITLTYFLVMLDSSIVATAIPQITTEFNSLLDVGWYGSAYQLASSSFQPLTGKIYSYFSTKWSFLAFFAVFELGSALCGAAQSSVMLIVGRAVAGLGSSGLMNGLMTILAAILPPHKQPMVMALNISLGQIGIACGPLLGGAFTEYVTWRWCFYINLPIGAVVAILLVLMKIPESTQKPTVKKVLAGLTSTLDLLGFVLFCPAAVMFFLALQWGGNRYEWDSSIVIGLFVGAGVTFIVFLLWERHRGEEAMVPFSMLRMRVIGSASATMFFFYGVLFVSNYYLPIYLQAVKGDSALMSGVHILPTILSQIACAMTAGTLVEVIGYYLPWTIGGTVFASIGYGLLSRLQSSSPTRDWVGYQIPYGLGCGAAAAMSYIAIQNSVPAAKIPTAMAIMIACQNFGGAVFLTVAQTVFSNGLRTLLAQDAPDVDAEQIIAAGARALDSLVPDDQIAGVREAYSGSIDRIMYLGVGLAIMSFFCAWGLGWKDIRVEKTKRKSNREE
ncbi:hypothetical protein AAE478_004223 [Parahypoxylon ruwenzoriense]